MKRVLSVQDISCIGKCSQTVAIPILSVLGIEVSILPVSLLSCHTAFEEYTFTELNNEILSIMSNWEKQKITFDGIYIGYLGTNNLIDISSYIIDTFSTQDTFILVDPAMADNGHLYSGIEKSYPSNIKTLINKAHVITPNYTEACILTQTPYMDIISNSAANSLLDSLHRLGAKKSIITGVYTNAEEISVYSKDSTKTQRFTSSKRNAVLHGTGDIFASTVMGMMIKTNDFEKSVKKAVQFTDLSIKKTTEDKNAPWYGVNFEEALPYLALNQD